MSRASVALDYLTELGGGERSGAAQVLAEFVAADPALFTEALKLVDWSADMRATTRIAGPWHRTPQASTRGDALRGNLAAEVRQTGRAWRVTIYNYPLAYPADPDVLGDFADREEGEGVADEALTSRESYRVWHLL